MGTNFQYKNGLSVCLLCTAVVYVRFLAISFIAELCVVDFHNPESKQALRAWADPWDFPLCAVWNSPRWATVDVLVWFGGTLRVRPVLFGFPFGLSAVFCLSTVDHLMYVLDLDEAICAGRRSSPGVSPRAEWTLG